MRYRSLVSRCLLAAFAVAALAGTAAAQTGRVGGQVKDEAGNPIKGATVQADNPAASPSTFTASTDDKGRFSIIGLRSGSWQFTATAAGYSPESGRMNVQTIGTPNPPLTFTLKKGGNNAIGGMAGMTGAASKEIQAEILAADQLYNTQQWDAAITAYKAIVAKVPALSAINLQVAACYRNKKEYDNAIAAYNEVLKADANNDKAKIGIGMTNLEKGDLKAAEDMLGQAAQSTSATKEVFYNLGEVKFAKGESDEAAKWYTRASEMDANWGKPWFKLALVALNKGDKEGALKMMEKVVASDPMSPEAAQAKGVIAELKK